MRTRYYSGFVEPFSDEGRSKLRIFVDWCSGAGVCTFGHLRLIRTMLSVPVRAALDKR